MAEFQSTHLNVDNLDLSSESGEFEPVDVRKYNMGSIQLVVSGATSSDSFTSLGTFTFKGSNDGRNYFDIDTSPVTMTVSAAAVNKVVLNLKVSYHFIKAIWTKNNSTGGSASLFAIFKSGVAVT